MLRPWVTLYYGFCLFQLGFLGSFGVRGQGPTPSFEKPDYVWWRGESITLQKYRNDGNCRQIAVNSSVPNHHITNGYNFDEQNGWLGGIDTVTFKLDSTSCVKVPSKKNGSPDNTWIKAQIMGGNNAGCSVASGPGQVPSFELQYFADSACSGSWLTNVNQMEVGYSISGDGSTCWSDRGAGGNYIYYRMFCNVARPITGQIVQTYPITHTNITHYIVNNITNYVPTNVRPDDLVPLIQTLMARNKSIFTVQSLSMFSPPAPPETKPMQINSINGSANTPQRSSASDTEMFMTYVTLFGLFALAVSFC